MNTTLKNRVLSVLLAAIMVFSLLPAPAFAAESGGADTRAAAENAAKGSGTKTDPLLIGTAEELEAFRDSVNSGKNALYVRLTADIDLSGKAWTAIGTNFKQYTGTFDGNGHTISGIQFADGSNTGLFGYVGTSGTVQDLFILANKENTLSSSGILVDTNYGAILRCSVEITATITVSGSGTFGIIASSNKGTIKDCYASSCVGSKVSDGTWIQTTVANPHIGGIAYMNLRGTIENCFFRGFLRTEKNGSNYTALDYAIVAYMQGTVTNSYCFNPLTYNYVDSSKRTDMYKVHYIYKDEQSGYDNGDIGVHPTDFDYRDENPLTTQNGSLTWQLNNGDGSGSSTNNEPWRLHVATNRGSDIHDYPTLRKTDSRVYKNADGTYNIVAPHFHEINGEQVEFTQVNSEEELRNINEGYVCLGSDVTTTAENWQPTGKVTFCLNGHDLNIQSDGILLKNGAELTLLNCSKKNTGHIGGTDTDSAPYGVAVNKGGTLLMESGCISKCGTGVIVDGGTFKMTGGEIKDCTTIAGIEYFSGSLTLGGHAKVADNKRSQNILLIQKGNKTPAIAFDDPQDDAIFGICMAKAGNTKFEAVTGRVAVTGENCEEYYKYLFADQFTLDGNDVSYDLYLTENGTIKIGEREAHTHCLCGAEHKAGECKDVSGNPVGHLQETQTTFATPWDPYATLDANGNPTLPTEAGSYYLTRSMTIESDGSSTWEPQGNVNLCLNGHTITYRVTNRPVDGNYEGWIRVLEGSTLTLTDCSEQGTVVCENRADMNRWINAFRVNGGTLNLYGGTVKSFMKAVYVESGTLNMYGGTLTENSSSLGGGGVYVDSDDSGSSGTFNLYGGKITGNMSTENRLDGSGTAQSYYNSRRRGGGVYVNRNAKGYLGTFNMYGGEISGNGAARGLENDEPIWQGGGVYAGGDFTMTGGTISGNSAAMFTTTKWQAYDPLGGGVYVGGQFTMTGGEISGNSLNGKNERYSFVGRGGGVYVGGQFTMTGGKITGNTVTSGVGGGVFVGGTSEISNATISGNKVSYNGSLTYNGAGGGIYASYASTITNSKITDNHVTDLKALSIANANLCSGGGGVFLGNKSSDSRSTITGCTITGNTLEGTTQSDRPNDRVGGGGVLVCQGAVTIENSTVTGNTMTSTDAAMLGGGVLYYPHVGRYTKSITLQGNVLVKDNTSGGSASNLYWEDPDTSSGSDLTELLVTIGGTLTGEASSIGVNRPNLPRIIAAAADGYPLNGSDAECFFDDSGRYVARVTADGTKIQLIPCPHDGGYENGICKICGEGCTHPADKVTEGADKKTVCGVCGQQMAVKVTNGETETYYAKTFDRTNTENTLQTILNDDTITPSGSKITLLADGLQAWAHVQNGKTITLALNGKKLIETGNGICASNVGSNNKLIITGTGRSDKNESLEFSYTFAVYDGTLEFDSSFGGKFNEIYVGGGTLTFADGQSAEICVLTIADSGATITPLKNGKFGKIILDVTRNDSIRAGTLLADGYAFRKADGSYVPYNSEITRSQAIEDVTVVQCDHAGLPDDFSGTTCPYCKATLTATVTANGKTTGYSAFQDALKAANASSGCTLTLLANVSDKLAVKAAITLKPNGYTVSGKVTVPKNASLTATGGTFSGAVNCVGTLDLTGSQLTGDLSVNGNVTLTNCPVSKPITVNKNGTLTFNGGSLTDVTVNNGGKLEFLSGNVSGTVTAKSGGTVTVSNGHIDTLTAENDATLSGGNFTTITVTGKNLIDCLAIGCAFQDTNGIVDGRTNNLTSVAVVAHPEHTHDWNTVTHELVCACGNVKETDNTAPQLLDSENDPLVDNKAYYGDLVFTVQEKNPATVTVDGSSVTPTDEKYTIPADNASHTIVATDPAGNTTTVTVKVNKLYTVTLPSGEGYTVEGSSTVGHEQEYTFKVTITPGYSRVSGSYKVLVNGVEATSLSGSETYDQFTVTAKDDLTITVQGVADITAPESVEIEIGGNKFREFLSTITFGLFFKNTQTVTVTATDKGSRVKTVEYLLSETALSEDSMPDEGWTAISNFADGKGSFNIAPNAMGSVYVRVTDAAGNAKVVNSQGVVVYTDSTANTQHITFTRLSTEGVSFEVNLNGNMVHALYITGPGHNGDEISGDLYMAGTDGSVDLENRFLRTLAAGDYTIRVTYKPMGVIYPDNPTVPNAPNDTAVKLTVERATRTLNFTANDTTYDGEEYDGLYIPETPAATVVHYKVQGADDSTYKTDAPKNAGSYTVRISTPQDENYNAATFTEDFTISPKEVTITGVTAANKVYNGSTEATITGTAALSDNYDGGNLTVQRGKANFADKNVGENKTVTFTGFALAGSAAGNYLLTAQPASVTADITAKNLTIENLKIKDKVYDGTNKAEFGGTPALNGVETGDDVQLNCGTPTFATTAVGEDITINFTDFTLTGADSGNYTLTQPTGITAKISAWNADGSEFTTTTQDWSNKPFTVTAKDGYLLSLTNTAIGNWVTSLTGTETTTGDAKSLTFYVKDVATGTISTANTRNYLYEITAPVGSITLNGSDSSQPSPLFFNGDVTVQISGADGESGVKSVAYYQSAKALTSEEVQAITTWTEGRNLTITAEDGAKFVVYARIEDKAGNVTYLSSNTAVFDTTAPKITGVEDGKTYYVTQRVFADDTNLASVTRNGSEMAMDSYFELAGDIDATYTIVATDKAGNVTTYTVTMKPISDITDAIESITEENVKSSDAEAIKAVEQQILAILSESDAEVIGEEQWNKLTEAAENCKKLQERIAAVAAEIARLTEAVNAYDIDKVTSADKAALEQLAADIQTLLDGSNLTDAERAALSDLLSTVNGLLARIAEAKAAAESEEITAVKDITKDNVTSDDKSALKKAEKALKDALEDFGGNYTDEESEELDKQVKTIREALEAIDNAKKATQEIEKLPSVDDVSIADKDEVERVKKLLDSLTDSERSMLGKDALDRITALEDKIRQLEESALRTGDESQIALWLTLLCLSGGMTAGAAILGSKKKHEE